MHLRVFFVILAVTVLVSLLTRIDQTTNPPAATVQEYPNVSRKRQYSSSNRSPDASQDGATETCDPEKQRTVIFIRHGRRLLWKIRYRKWLEENFDDEGNYVPTDPNVPKKLIDRKGGLDAYEHDSPLWVPSFNEAKELGKIFKENKISVKHVYSSLPLRCIETTHAILKGMGERIPVNVESGLHERAMIHDQQEYIEPHQLNREGFYINESYTSFYPRFDINTIAQVHSRLHNVTRHIMDKHENEGGNILIIAHANTGEMTVRLLTGEAVPSNLETVRIVRKACKVPDFAITIARESCDKKAFWTRVNTKKLPYSYDWRCVDKYLTPDNSLRILPNGTWLIRGGD